MRFSVFFFLICAACSSGGSGSGIDENPREVLVPIIPVENLAPSGKATYQGNIALQFLSPLSGTARDLDGDLTLEVDFDNMGAAVTGSASGFHEETTTFTGNLLVNTAALDDSSGGLDFNTNITGALLAGTSNYLIAGQLRGEVLGTGETAARGNVSGTVLERGTPRQLSGDFQAGRRP